MLQQLVPQAQVVKSFNVLSAYALENNVQQQAKQVSFLIQSLIYDDTSSSAYWFHTRILPM